LAEEEFFEGIEEAEGNESVAEESMHTTGPEVYDLELMRRGFKAWGGHDDASDTDATEQSEDYGDMLIIFVGELNCKLLASTFETWKTTQPRAKSEPSASSLACSIEDQLTILSTKSEKKLLTSTFEAWKGYQPSLPDEDLDLALLACIFEAWKGEQTVILGEVSNMKLLASTFSAWNTSGFSSQDEELSQEEQPVMLGKVSNSSDLSSQDKQVSLHEQPNCSKDELKQDEEVSQDDEISLDEESNAEEESNEKGESSEEEEEEESSEDDAVCQHLQKYWLPRTFQAWKNGEQPIISGERFSKKLLGTTFEAWKFHQPRFQDEIHLALVCGTFEAWKSARADEQPSSRNEAMTLDFEPCKEECNISMAPQRKSTGWLWETVVRSAFEQEEGRARIQAALVHTAKFAKEGRTPARAPEVDEETGHIDQDASANDAQEQGEHAPASVNEEVISKDASVNDAQEQGEDAPASVDEEASASVDEEASASVDEEASASVNEEAVASVKEEASASDIEEASASVQEVASASAKEDASASDNEEAAASVIAEASGSVNEDVAVSVQEEASASDNEEASASVKEEASASAQEGASASDNEEASASNNEEAVSSDSDHEPNYVRHTWPAETSRFSGCNVS